MKEYASFRHLLLIFFAIIQCQLFGQYFAIGNDTLTTGDYDPSPVNIWYRSHRQQIVYSKAELNAVGISGGQILQLGWYVVSPPLYPLPNYTISLKHDTVRDGSSEIPGPFTQVLQIPAYMPTAGGFDMLVLDTPFVWNGIDNLVVDVCWDRVNPSYDNSGRVRYYIDSSYTTAYERDDSEDMCGESIDDDTPDKPQIQFLLSPSVPNDAGAVKLNQGNVVCSGSQPIIATVANWGNNQITSLTVNWSVNGVVQTAGSITGTLDTLQGMGSYTQMVSLGSYSFTPGVSYEIKVWTSLPNGVVDTLNFNDTLIVNSTVGMAGTYTVGGASPDYPTFTAAIADLIAKGVCDTVYIQARPGTYVERLAIPEIEGAGPGAWIIFESESGDSSSVTISHGATSSLNHVIRLENTSFVQFRKVTLEATGTSYSRVVELEGSLSHIGFHNCRFLGRSGITSSSSSYALVYEGSGAPNLNNITFKRNLFKDGSWGLYLEASSGSHLLIESNRFEGQYYNQIYVEDVSYVSIISNHIMNTSSNTYAIAITVSQSDSALAVTGNIITGMRGGTGIYLTDCYNSEVNMGIVANNFIQIGDPGVSGSTGIELYYCEYVQCTYNSVNITDCSSGCLAFRYYYGNDNYLYNNNFRSNSEAVIAVNGGGSISSSDYNNFYSTGGLIGEWDDPVANLAELRMADGMDSNSVSVDPFFISAMSYAVAQIALNNAAMPIPDITMDIESDPRDPMTPDIGADEFSPSGLDIGVDNLVTPSVPFMSDTYPVLAVVRNHGATTVTSFTLNWEINDVSQTSVMWTGSLASGDTALVLLDTVNFLPGVEFSFEAYSSVPNGLADPIAINDTAEVIGVLAGLGGVYTIGGLAPDFPNFTSAVAALIAGGIYDTVTFKVRSGTYTEQVQISTFPKTDPGLHVVFESESLDSSLVTLSYSTGSSNNYVLELDGVHGLYFRHLTLRNTASYTYNRVVTMYNGGTDIGFSNCRIWGNTYSSTSTGRVLVYCVNSEPVSNISFDRVRFEGGSTGLYMSFGNFLKPWMNNITVTHCTMLNQYYQGIYIYRAENMQLADNYLMSGTNHSTAYHSARIYYCDGLEINSNRFLGGTSSSVHGLYLDDIGPHSDGTRSLLSNNFVQTAGTVIGDGIELTDCDSVDIFHNSVLVINNQTYSSGLKIGSGNSGTRILNNIFENVGGGFALYIIDSAGLDISDFNNLYSSGPGLVYADFISHADLSTWQSFWGKDSNSISAQSGFIDSLDLHATSSVLNAAATPVSSVDYDIDDDPRNPIMPDIGADEFDIPTDDAAIIGLNGPSSPMNPGLQPVLISLLNNGADTMVSVTVDWTVNDSMQTSYNWTGSLASGESVDSVNIGSFNFLPDSLYDLKIWVSMPNGQTDALNTNDTLRVNDLVTGLAGIYYIGGTTPDFNNFQEASHALNGRGVIDWVTFLVADGTYTGQFSISEIEGASAEDSIVFMGANGDTSVAEAFQSSTSSSNNYLMRLNGTDYITFKNLRFRRSGSTYQQVIFIDSGSVNVTITDCHLSTSTYNTTSTNLSILSVSGSYPNMNLHVKNNTFLNGAYGIRMTGSSIVPQDGCVIENNLFKNQRYRSMYIYYQDNLKVHDNVVTSYATYTSYSGIMLYSSRAVDVQRNSVIINNSGYYGMYLDELQPLGSTRSLVANNFIYAAGSGSLRAIFFYDSDSTDLVFNTVHSNRSSGSTHTFWDNGQHDSSRVLNNIFYNSDGGYAVFVTNINGAAFSDYNNLYTTGPVLGNWNGDVTDLAGWQDTSMQDSHSYSAILEFAPDTNVHIQAGSMNGAAMPVPGVIYDIDGEMRNASTPDIGADEFSLPPNEVAIFSFDGPKIPFLAGASDVRISLLNNGEDTLKSVLINWSVNGVLQTPLFWTGNLLSGEQLDSIPIGNYNFTQDTTHNVKVWTSFPNGGADANNDNDTIEALNLFPALSGVYTIGGFEPDFENFTRAVSALNNGGVVGWVTFNVRAGTYNEQISIGEIVGVSSSDSILFQSELLDASTVSLEFSGSYVVYINGANHLTFKHLTIKGLSLTGIEVFSIDGTTLDTRLDNCVLMIPSTSTATNGTYLVYSEDNGLNTNLRIIDCEFRNAAYGIYGDGYDSGLETGFLLRNSSFYNQRTQSVYLYRYNGPKIHENMFVNEHTSFARAIYLNRTYYDMELVKNRIHAARAGHGIEIYDHFSSTANTALVANNFVTTCDSAAYSSRSLYVRNSDDINFYHNNIHQASTHSLAYAAYISSSYDIRLVNNVIANTGGGVAMYTNNSSGFISCDYNDLYSSGATLINGPSAYTDLTSWFFGTGLDANSVSVDPVFYSSVDLHVAQSALDSAATPLAEVVDDIDEEMRDPNYPDIGADEVLFFPDDLAVTGVFAPISNCEFADSNQVTIRVNNNGSGAQFNFNLYLVVDGDTTSEMVALVNGGETYFHTFANYYDFSQVGSYNVISWADISMDVNRANDTLVTQITHFVDPVTTLTDDLTICARAVGLSEGYRGSYLLLEQWGIWSLPDCYSVGNHSIYRNHYQYQRLYGNRFCYGNSRESYCLLYINSS